MLLSIRMLCVHGHVCVPICVHVLCVCVWTDETVKLICNGNMQSIYSNPKLNFDFNSGIHNLDIVDYHKIRH